MTGKGCVGLPQVEGATDTTTVNGLNSSAGTTRGNDHGYTRGTSPADASAEISRNISPAERFDNNPVYPSRQRSIDRSPVNTETYLNQIDSLVQLRSGQRKPQLRSPEDHHLPGINAVYSAV